MDVHTESIAVAYVAPDHGAEVTSLGPLGTRQCDMDQRLRQMPSKAPHLILVYAAGPCGSWLSRSLLKTGDACWVVAPSLSPTKPGDRVTTARRDALPLARLARSGARTAVEVPKGEDEAMRHLPRARADALSDCQDATLRLQAFLLRHAIRSPGRAPWGPGHWRWLSAVGCPPPAPHLVLQADLRAVSAHHERLPRLEPALQEHVQAWRLSPGGEALQARRGVPCTVAVTLGAARGALTRLESPRERMPLRGLLPSAYASGAPRRQGSMPQAGNPHARRVLGEGAWAYRAPAQVRRQ
jgi:transposase